MLCQGQEWCPPSALSPNEDGRDSSATAVAVGPGQVGCSHLPCGWDPLPEPPPAQVLTLGRPRGGSRRAAKYKVLPWTLKCLAAALKHAVMEIREDKEFTICSGCDPAKTT